jgi:hypothetical protein
MELHLIWTHNHYFCVVLTKPQLTCDFHHHSHLSFKSFCYVFLDWSLPSSLVDVRCWMLYHYVGIKQLPFNAIYATKLIECNVHKLLIFSLINVIKSLNRLNTKKLCVGFTFVWLLLIPTHSKVCEMLI